MQRPLLLVLALAGCSSPGASTDSAESRDSTAQRVVRPRIVDTTRGPASTIDTVASRRIALPFRARGNEPGWSLDVGTREMTLVADYGERRVVASTPAPTTAGDTTRWTTSAQEHEILVTVVDRLCHDGMSGFPFPRTVAVRLDGRELTGCGGESVEVLLGPAWIVRSVDGATVPDASRPTLRFMADGRVVGRAPCNGFGAGYTLRGDELAFSDISATMMACVPAVVMQREQRFLALLAAVRRFERSGDTLILRTEDGRAIIARR
ncbi:MAG TPA: META domain-containing protein [Gemmatimonadaceae bacterium]|nr:META domain-containing protein [Gemmatimonadaceae bacterium]